MIGHFNGPTNIVFPSGVRYMLRPASRIGMSMPSRVIFAAADTSPVTESV